MKHKKSLLWFRNNLRTSDNPILNEAIERSDSVLLLYIFDERHWQENAIGLKTSANKKLTFLWDSVMALKQKIEAKGGSLLVAKGKPEEVISGLQLKHNFDAFYTTIESGVYEKEALNAIEQMLMKANLSTYSISQSTLYHTDDIPWPINKLPAVFTQFRKENEKQTEIRSICAEPDDLAICFSKNEDYDPKNFDIEISYGNNKSAVSFEGGEKAAFERLHYYFWETDLIQQYKQTRNGLLGGDYSSKFSPWLALGCISPRTIYFELKKYEKERKSNQSTYWLFFELVWRDYFHFILKKHGSLLFSANGIKEERYNWSTSVEDFERWATGETGVPFVDANMIELNETGYMSNRGRQNVASFLTHDLNIDWRWGACYFERHLIDYEVASNWGNWAYVAGVGNDPRENRYFNILSQAKKYDQKGDYIRYWIPSLTKVVGFNAHKVALLTDERKLELTEVEQHYFEPLVDLSKWDF